MNWLRRLWEVLTFKDARDQRRAHREDLRARAEEIFFINYGGKRIHTPKYCGAVGAWPDEPPETEQAACFWIVAEAFEHNGRTVELGSCLVFRRDLTPSWRIRHPHDQASPSTLLDANLWACEICYGKETGK